MANASMFEDMARGEIIVRATIKIAYGGLWSLCEVVAPEHDCDQWRAYPEADISNRDGLVCLSTTDKDSLVNYVKDYR